MPHAFRCGRGSRLAPGHERGATHCVCVCATQPGAGCGVCSSRGRAGCGGCGREGTPHATLCWRRSLPAAHRHLCACDRRAGGGRAPWSPREMRVAAQPQVCGRGHYQRTKIKQLVFQSQARRSRRHASRPGPRAPREARLPRGARAQSRKKAAARRGTDSRGGAPDARPKTHALQNDTPRPEPAPAGMLQGLPIAAERRAVGWGGMGRGAEEGVATSTAGLPAAPGARERRGAACADLLPDTFPPLPVNGCRSGRKPGPLRLPGWAAASGG